MSSTLNEYGGPTVLPSHFSTSGRRSGAWLVCCAALGSLIVCGAAFGQQTTTPAGGDVSLAEVVPNSVGIFIEIDRLVGADHSVRARNAHKLYELMVGSAHASSEWNRFAIDSLGFTAGQSGEELFTRRFAVAAPSWKTLSDGMMVISLIKDDPLLDETFAPYDNGDAQPSSGRMAIYKTKAGLSASTNGDILIIAQQDRKGSLFDQAVRLMSGSADSSLGRRASFRRQTSRLPPGRAGLVYLDWTEGVADFLSPFDLRRAAIGLYLDADRVELVVRAVRSDQTALSPPVNTDWSRRLPQTSLAAWCTRVDVARAFEAVLAQSTASEPRRFLDILRRVLEDEGVGERITATLGPDAVIVWDQHLGPGRIRRNWRSCSRPTTRSNP